MKAVRAVSEQSRQKGFTLLTSQELGPRGAQAFSPVKDFRGFESCGCRPETHGPVFV